MLGLALLMTLMCVGDLFSQRTVLDTIERRTYDTRLLGTSLDWLPEFGHGTPSEAKTIFGRLVEDVSDPVNRYSLERCGNA